MVGGLGEARGGISRAGGLSSRDVELARRVKIRISRRAQSVVFEDRQDWSERSSGQSVDGEGIA